jgi:predicted lipoprotein with Yx(FWY)xxD motif
MSKQAIRIGVGLCLAVIVAAACSSPGASTATQAAPSAAPPSVASVAPSEPASEAPSAAASQPAAAATVEAEEVGDAGTILVDGATGLTVYNFTMDVKDSGTSACTGGCLETWPALTVPAGGSPTGGTGVTGTLGTITRADDGSLQVTYNGLPLYFFKNDQAPGDLAGVYDKWVTVAP